MEEVLACDTSCVWVFGAPLYCRWTSKVILRCMLPWRHFAEVPSFLPRAVHLACEQAPRNEVATVSCLLENMAGRHSARVLQ